MRRACALVSRCTDEGYARVPDRRTAGRTDRRVAKQRHARIESLGPKEPKPILCLALQGAFSRAPDRRMNPESELVDERRREQGPSQLAAAVQQQIGRKLGLEPRDSVSCIAFEERRVPLERAVKRA